VRSTSLSNAKAQLSELVNAAEHRGQSTLILKRGKPAAAIVPVEVATPERTRRLTLKEAEESVRAFVNEFSSAEPDVSAVEELQRSRR
jgi:prevent-host-death family protein